MLNLREPSVRRALTLLAIRNVEYPMSIHQAKIAPRREIQKCATGIPGLDQITEGGLPNEDECWFCSI